MKKQENNPKEPSPSAPEMVNANLKDLLSVFERVISQKRGDAVLKLLTEYQEKHVDVPVMLPKELMLAFQSNTRVAPDEANIACWGGTYHVAVTVKVASVVMPGSGVRANFRLTLKHKKCRPEPVSVSIDNTTRGSSISLPYGALSGGGPAYVASGIAPSDWETGDTVDVRVNYRVVPVGWCDTCVATASSSTDTLFIT